MYVTMVTAGNDHLNANDMVLSGQRSSEGTKCGAARAAPAAPPPTALMQTLTVLKVSIDPFIVDSPGEAHTRLVVIVKHSCNYYSRNLQD